MPIRQSNEDWVKSWIKYNITKGFINMIMVSKELLDKSAGNSKKNSRFSGKYAWKEALLHIHQLHLSSSHVGYLVQNFYFVLSSLSSNFSNVRYYRIYDILLNCILCIPQTKAWPFAFNWNLVLMFIAF